MTVTINNVLYPSADVVETVDIGATINERADGTIRRGTSGLTVKTRLYRIGPLSEAEMAIIDGLTTCNIDGADGAIIDSDVEFVQSNDTCGWTVSFTFLIFPTVEEDYILTDDGKKIEVSSGNYLIR